MTKVLLVVTVVLGFFFAIGTGNLWQQVLLYMNSAPFGYADPIFNRDASFFVFALPIAQRVVSFLGFTLFLTFLGTLGLYVFDRRVEAEDGPRIRLAAHVKGHLSSLAAAALLVKAVDYLLRRGNSCSRPEAWSSAPATPTCTRNSPCSVSWPWSH